MHGLPSYTTQTRESLRRVFKVTLCGKCFQNNIRHSNLLSVPQLSFFFVVFIFIAFLVFIYRSVNSNGETSWFVQTFDRLRFSYFHKRFSLLTFITKMVRLLKKCKIYIP